MKNFLSKDDTELEIGFAIAKAFKSNVSRKIISTVTASAFVGLMLTASSCKNDATEPNNPEPIPCITVEPVKVDSAMAMQLDEVFLNLLGLHYQNFLEIQEVYVINSPEYTEEYEEFKFLSPINIDFNQYTLIGGVLFISSIPYEILSDELCKNNSTKTYTRKFSIKQGDATQVCRIPYWNLYPKLDTNFQVVFEKNINKGETE